MLRSIEMEVMRDAQGRGKAMKCGVVCHRPVELPEWAVKLEERGEVHFQEGEEEVVLPVLSVRS